MESSISTLSAGILLFLIMDPLGNVPLFLSLLKNVAPERRRRVLVRELLIALAALFGFLLGGAYVLKALQLRAESISIAGGIVLFLIGVKMIFPPRDGSIFGGATGAEPFIVPMAIPGVAGPSAMAALMLMTNSEPGRTADWVLALFCAWLATALILLSSTYLYRWLGASVLTAIERLMGMLLVALLVQMLPVARGPDMISVERSFFDRFPQLAAGRARSFSQPVVELLRKITCEDQINRTLAQCDTSSGFDFVERALDVLSVSYRIANTDRDNIPAEGRLVVVANHPLGALDALALLHLIGTVRRDVHILGNDMLAQLAPLSTLLLPVDVFGGGASVARMRAAYRALEREEALVVFPAGEVSRVSAQGIRDGAWSNGFARLALRADAPVLPVHIAAHNSPGFYGLSMLVKPLSALLLAREMFGAAGARIGISVGETVAAQEIGKAPASRAAQSMRRHVYQLARRRPTVFATSRAIAHPESPLALRSALRRAELLGSTRDGKRILLLDAQPDCPLLREIGRLRELSFRRVGEGTGARRDIDRFDSWYQHLVLWDEHALAIVGAYRLGEAATIIPARGKSGLYSATLFDYSRAADDFLLQSVELGRSFVQPAFWGSRSLDYLWQGIGAYLRSRPQVRYLLGPVSLSAALPSEARDWIVHCHRHYFGDLEGLARARNPWVPSAAVAADAEGVWCGRSAQDGLTQLHQQLARYGVRLPVLYRQYVELCEPGGVRFLAFGNDPAFGHCTDGLIRLDMHRLRPTKRARYLACDEGDVKGLADVRKLS